MHRFTMSFYVTVLTAIAFGYIVNFTGMSALVNGIFSAFFAGGTDALAYSWASFQKFLAALPSGINGYAYESLKDAHTALGLLIDDTYYPATHAAFAKFYAIGWITGFGLVTMFLSITPALMVALFVALSTIVGGGIAGARGALHAKRARAAA